MARSVSRSLLISVLAVGAFAACSKDKGGGAGGGAAAANHEDGAEGLKAYFEQAAAACNAKDYQKGKAHTLSVLPTRDQLRKIFKDDAPPEMIDKIAAQYEQLPPGDEKAACVFVPGKNRTEIRVHASTVEDLAAYKEGTPAYAEFPGGARTLAEKFLKGGTTFYEVEVTEPGKDSGTKYHMFFWDGAQWRMLGPAWRAAR